VQRRVELVQNPVLVDSPTQVASGGPPVVVGGVSRPLDARRVLPTRGQSSPGRVHRQSPDSTKAAQTYGGGGPSSLARSQPLRLPQLASIHSWACRNASALPWGLSDQTRR